MYSLSELHSRALSSEVWAELIWKKCRKCGKSFLTFRLLINKEDMIQYNLSDVKKISAALQVVFSGDQLIIKLIGVNSGNDSTANEICTVNFWNWFLQIIPSHFKIFEAVSYNDLVVIWIFTHRLYQVQVLTNSLPAVPCW